MIFELENLNRAVDHPGTPFAMEAWASQDSELAIERFVRAFSPA